MLFKFLEFLVLTPDFLLGGEFVCVCVCVCACVCVCVCKVTLVIPRQGRAVSFAHLPSCNTKWTLSCCEAQFMWLWLWLWLRLWLRLRLHESPAGVSAPQW